MLVVLYLSHCQYVSCVQDEIKEYIKIAWINAFVDLSNLHLVEEQIYQI